MEGGAVLRRLLPAVAVTLGLLVPMADASVNPRRTVSQEATPAPSANPAPTVPPIRILWVGDSISACWQGELQGQPECLDRYLRPLMAAAGQPYTLRVEAVPGKSADYFLPLIDGILADYQPDLVIYALGTNSNCVPDNGAQLQQQMSALYDKALHSRLWHVKIAPVFVTYSRWPDAPAWVRDSEPVCDDAIYRAQAQYPPANQMIAGYVPLDQIPTAYLRQDGIHYSELATQTMVRMFYDGVASTYGWVPVAPLPCGLDGHRPGSPAPTYTPCPAA